MYPKFGTRVLITLKSGETFKTRMQEAYEDYINTEHYKRLEPNLIQSLQELTPSKKSANSKPKACTRCAGTGQYRKFGECFSCGGLGVK